VNQAAILGTRATHNACRYAGTPRPVAENVKAQTTFSI